MKNKFFLLLCSAWMIGIGFRFILMQETNIYTHSFFDKLFDWGMLFLLGTTLFYSVLFSYIEEKKVKKSQETNS